MTIRTRPVRSTRAFTAAALFAATLASGCAAVAPYERGLLASRVMRPDPDPAETKLDAHVAEYREGSMGGSGVSGGGCGCN
jgi:hypothetical protein